MSLNQFEEDVQSLFGRQIGIKLIVCSFSFFKTAEQLNDSLHEGTLPLSMISRRPVR
jgi:hypothetical protein